MQDGTGLHDAADDILPADGFARWVDSLNAQEHTPRTPGHVTCTYRWIVEDDTYLGAISFRHDLTDYLENFGGHIGYGVRPSARRRGLANWALGQTIELARERAYPRVLVCCVDGNEASARTIVGQGGVLDDMRTDSRGVVFRRYWIPVTPA